MLGTVADPLFVKAEGMGLTTFHKFGSVSAVPDTTKTTIVSVTFAVQVIENLSLMVASGDVYAKYYLTLNGVDFEIRRSGPDPNVLFDFRAGAYGLIVGDILDVKVQHFQTGQLLDFNATLYGYA